MDTITADRAVARVARLSEHITDSEATLAYRIDEALDALVYDGCFTPHWASSAARDKLCKLAARMAMLVVLAEAKLPAEVAALHRQEIAQ